MTDEKLVLSAAAPTWRISLRLKGYLAYGALTVFAIILSVFVFHQKNVLLKQFYHLQHAYESEILLHEVEAKVFNAIEIQALNIEGIDIGLGPDHVRSHLRQFQNVYHNTVIKYFRDTDEVKALGQALQSANESPRLDTLHNLSGKLDDLKKMLEQRLAISQRFRRTLVNGFRQRSDSVAKVSLFMGLFSLALLGAIIGVFFTRLTNDLLLLKKRGQQIIRGVRDNPVPIKRNDEVGELADAVNRMAEDLEEHERILEIERQKSFHREKMAAIGTLAAGIAHEVGNPIAAISALVEEVIQEKLKGNCPYLNDNDVCQLKMVLEHTQRLSNVTREISGLAQPQSKEAQLFDLNAAIRSTCNLMHYDARWKNIELSLELDKELPAVNGVSDQIIQIIMNLLVNASDALEQVQGRAPHVWVRTGTKENKVYLSVEDNGHGMDEETLKNAKQAFFTTKRVGKGTGLGLSLCNSIVSAHNGSLEIESVQNEGTTVRVYLPLETTGDEEQAS